MRNPQSNDLPRTLRIGPTLKQFLNSSMYATINTVPGRALPRKGRRRRQDLVRPVQLRDLPAQCLELIHRVLVRLPRLRGDRYVCLVTPTAQRSQGNPGSFEICSIAFVCEEYRERDSISNLTPLVLNSGVYRVCFAMVPSSPIELGKYGTKTDHIKHRMNYLKCLPIIMNFNLSVWRVDGLRGEAFLQMSV